ncbi:substrate-binding domain-containing protein [Herbaspirillum sp. DW155]|uniref:substrate-binding domain-containing protein n=1 Tax=Herbaspirillum sp. DW155 TaxID=3095609 RepID=UPI003091774C|nr:substrate-binding domain-containing protein [Herbaspirillum sp. DW155]
MQRRTFLGRTLIGVTGMASSSVLGLAGALTARNAHAADTLKVGAMIPASGPAGLFGPSSKNCCLLAQDDINARGGILGQKIEVLFGDAGAGPEAATQTALKLWKGAGVRAFVGMHDSAVRGALTTMLRGQVPYFYTASYEGGECSPGVYVTGETPAQQLAPVIPWLSEQRKLKRWYLIGNDYSWPRETNAIARTHIASSGGSVVGEEYVPFSVDNFDASLAKIRASGADAVLITLVGGASVSFNRAFAGLGLAAGITRLGTLIEENTLAGIGVQNAENLYSSAGYFAALQTAPAKAFAARYQARFKGPDAQLNSLAESCYEGFLMFEELARRAGKITVPAFNVASEGAHYDGPRGRVEMHQRHVVEDILVARASPSGFEIAKTFPAVGAGQSCKV